MSGAVQLFVVRRGLDPSAWTALHTLRENRPDTPVAAAARADLWEFEWPSRLEPARLTAWVEAANWFANPTRDRLLWRLGHDALPDLGAHAARPDGGLGAGEPGGLLLAVWREGGRAHEHEVLARQATGESVTIRHGTAWWLVVASGRDLANLEEVGESGGGGLFVHPMSQWGRWYGTAFPNPAIGPEVEARPTPVRTGASP